MAPDTPHAGRSKRQAHAERQRALQMLSAFSTRLQYAMFKVENGWTRQSLSEVENLYYRRQLNAPKRAPDTRAPPTPTPKNGPTHTEKRSPAPRDSPVDTSTYADFWSRLGASRTSPDPTRGPSEPNEETREKRKADDALPTTPPPAQPSPSPQPATASHAAQPAESAQMYAPDTSPARALHASDEAHTMKRARLDAPS
ncbi:hypothetical protein MBRA1_001279 [Malassezia brasiliensis]|uniref:Uncharacterized protein n=1 Tax=Malassezia brasiliensis TaxID=1821822 RepID=A0AAF0DV65_9BASI|nr:hypothetical protein MBRA1_001279 [Malassezia brasiliensis]